MNAGILECSRSAGHLTVRIDPGAAETAVEPVVAALVAFATATEAGHGTVDEVGNHNNC